MCLVLQWRTPNGGLWMLLNEILLRKKWCLVVITFQQKTSLNRTLEPKNADSRWRHKFNNKFFSKNFTLKLNLNQNHNHSPKHTKDVSSSTHINVNTIIRTASIQYKNPTHFHIPDAILHVYWEPSRYTFHVPDVISCFSTGFQTWITFYYKLAIGIKVLKYKPLHLNSILTKIKFAITRPNTLIS